MTVKIDAEGVRHLFPEVDGIKDAALRQGVIDIWIEVGAECGWARFEDVPKNADGERHRPLVQHIRGVTQMASALAEVAERLQGVKVNHDYLLAACLLHDVSKPLESEPDPGGKPTNGPVLPARKSAMGEKIQHAVYATHKVFAHRLPLEVAHIVNTHTHASNMRSKTLEGAFLFYADYADSDAAIIPVGGKAFVQRWEIG